MLLEIPEGWGFIFLLKNRNSGEVGGGGGEWWVRIARLGKCLHVALLNSIWASSLA